MSDQLLKFFNITPHAFFGLEASKQSEAFGQISEFAQLIKEKRENFISRLKDNILPQKTASQSHDIGAVICGIKDEDLLLKFLDFLLQSEKLPRKEYKLLIYLKTKGRIVYNLNLDFEPKELVENEDFFIDEKLSSILCGTVCSANLEERYRPKKSFDNSIKSNAYPSWWRGEKLDKEKLQDEEFWAAQLSNLFGFARKIDYFDNFYCVKLLKYEYVGPFCKSKRPVFDGDYKNSINMIKLFGLMRDNADTEFTIHKQRFSNQKPNITQKQVDELKSYFSYNKKLLKGIKKISLKQWNKVHDRNLCGNLGGIRLGLGFKDQKETGVDLLDWEFCNNQRTKYHGSGNYDVKAVSFDRKVFRNFVGNEITLYKS